MSLQNDIVEWLPHLHWVWTLQDQEIILPPCLQNLAWHLAQGTGGPYLLGEWTLNTQMNEQSNVRQMNGEAKQRKLNMPCLGSMWQLERERVCRMLYLAASCLLPNYLIERIFQVNDSLYGWWRPWNRYLQGGCWAPFTQESDHTEACAEVAEAEQS